MLGMVDSGNDGEEDETKDEQEQRTGTVIPDEIKATITDLELVNGMKKKTGNMF